MISVRRLLTPSNTALLRHRYYSTTTTPKPKSKFPKPTQVPFQPKLANSVNLIGTVNKPLQFQTCPDGNPFASTVITQNPCCSLLIPVVFVGDLAHIANFHVKLNDVIHVEGQLSTDPLHSIHKFKFQVMAQSLNFVQDYPNAKKASLTSKQKLASSSESEDDEINPLKKDIHSEQTEGHDKVKSWRDILNKPSESQDVHSTKESPKVQAFERKTDSEPQPELKQSISSAKKYPESLSNSWANLLNDPNQWWDFRDSKHNGLVNPRYPDFKRKDGDVPIWIDKAPKWVLSKLAELKFDAPAVKFKKEKVSNELKFDAPAVKSREEKVSKDEREQSWNDLLQNPAKWWDNRLDKKNERAPDFKHKDTGEALWLRGSPSWVLPKLPPLKPKQKPVS